MTTTKPRGWFGRTNLITIASIAGVAAAGAFAISANVGILNAADNSKLGQLSAAGAATTPNTQVVDVYLDGSATTATAAGVIATTAGDPAAVQRFTVDAAGTIAVVANGGSLRLDSVDPTSGWTWSLAQNQPTQLTVTFTNGTRTLEFVAGLGPDGSVTANVNEPAATAAATTAPSNGGSGHDGHEYEGGEDDD
jgi:hypothetical protein